MNARQLNTLLCYISSYVPIELQEKPLERDGQVSIRLIRNNHWATVFKVDGREVRFDSQPFQNSDTCGLFAVVAVLTFATEGIEGVRALWEAFKRADLGEPEVFRVVMEWMSSQNE